MSVSYLNDLLCAVELTLVTEMGGLWFQESSWGFQEVKDWTPSWEICFQWRNHLHADHRQWSNARIQGWCFWWASLVQPFSVGSTSPSWGLWTKCLSQHAHWFGPQNFPWMLSPVVVNVEAIREYLFVRQEGSTFIEFCWREVSWHRESALFPVRGKHWIVPSQVYDMLKVLPRLFGKKENCTWLCSTLRCLDVSLSCLCQLQENARTHESHLIFWQEKNQKADARWAYLCHDSVAWTTAQFSLRWDQDGHAKLTRMISDRVQPSKIIQTHCAEKLNMLEQPKAVSS